MKTILSLLVLFAVSPSQAMISEEIDDLASFSCVGSKFELVYAGDKVTGFATDIRGVKRPIVGKLASVTINVDDESINPLIVLESFSVPQFRFISVKSIDGGAQAGFYAKRDGQGWDIGAGQCDFVWK